MPTTVEISLTSLAKFDLNAIGAVYTCFFVGRQAMNPSYFVTFAHKRLPLSTAMSRPYWTLRLVHRLHIHSA